MVSYHQLNWLAVFTRRPCLEYLGLLNLSYGLPSWLSGNELSCQYRRCEFDPWVRNIPWRRKWRPIPVFLLGKSHGQRNLEGYSPWGLKELDTTERACKPLLFWGGAPRVRGRWGRKPEDPSHTTQERALQGHNWVMVRPTDRICQRERKTKMGKEKSEILHIPGVYNVGILN